MLVEDQPNQLDDVECWCNYHGLSGIAVPWKHQLFVSLSMTAFT